MTPTLPTPDPALPRRLVSRRVFLAAGGSAVLAACVACSAATSATPAATTSAAPATVGDSASRSGTAAPAASSPTVSAITEPSTDGVSPAASSAESSASSGGSELRTDESTASADPTGEKSGSSAAVSSSSAVPSGTVVAAVSDIPSGGGLIVNGTDGTPLILADNNGQVVAHSAICTHQGSEVGADGICPKHGSVFDIVTGAVIQGPATQALPEVAVTVADGNVYVS